MRVPMEIQKEFKENKLSSWELWRRLEEICKKIGLEEEYKIQLFNKYFKIQI